MRKPSKDPVVTRTVSSWRLSKTKLEELRVLAERCGQLRSYVWQMYDTPEYFLKINVRGIRDKEWMGKGRFQKEFKLPDSIGYETLRDCLNNIAASHEAAMYFIARDVYRHIPGKKDDDKEQKVKTDQQRFALLARVYNGSWQRDPWLHRTVRKYWSHRGKNHCFNQIVYAPFMFAWFQRNNQGWIKVQGLGSRKRIAIPLNSNRPILSTIRLIVHSDHVQIHYTLPETQGKPCGKGEVGVDMGYTEVFTVAVPGDNPEPLRFGEGFGTLQSADGKRHEVKQKARNHLHTIAKKEEAKAADALEKGDTTAAKKHQAKASRIQVNNLGKKKKDAYNLHTKQLIRGFVYEAAHKLVDIADTIVHENLNFGAKKRKKGQKRKFSRKTTGLLSRWRKQVAKEAFSSVSRRRGATPHSVNAAYTSQICSLCGAFGHRDGNMFYCTSCGAVLDADWNAAVNVLLRDTDSEISLWTSPQKAKSVLEERYNHRQRLRRSRLDSAIAAKAAIAESEQVSQ